MNDISNTTGKRNYIDTDTLLTGLSLYGKVWLFGNQQDGWKASVDMFVTGKGVTFEIKSDSKCKSPHDALTQLNNRVQQTLIDLKAGKDV